MVNVGFIVEGDTEKIIIDSKQFKKEATGLGINILDPVINARGNGNLLPQNIDNFTAKLISLKAEKIIVVTDADTHSIAEVKKRICPPGEPTKIDFVIVAVKAFEAWFLACEDLMKKSLNYPGFCIDRPEETPQSPYDYIKSLASNPNIHGPGTKTNFARRVLKNGFSIKIAAQNPNCPSAKYFLDKLTETGRAI